MEGGFVARECEQDGAGGAGVHTIAGPAFSLSISGSQQPSERLRGPSPRGEFPDWLIHQGSVGSHPC